MIPVVTATLSSEIFLPKNEVDAQLAEFIAKNLAFANPRIGELLRLGYSIWRVPKKIICYRSSSKGYHLPLGFGPCLRQFITGRGQQLALDDQRTEIATVPVVSKIKLKAPQEKVLPQLLKLHRCILEARPGFGKTMMGIEVLARRGQQTLIIVHTRALLNQWHKRLSDFCTLLPDGIGIIGEGKWQLGSQVTIAMYQTLLSRGTKSIAKKFGLVIVDECHHVPANTFSKIVKSFASKYCLGLSATPYRKDKLDRLLNFYIGKIITTQMVESSCPHSLLPPAKMPTTLYWRETSVVIPDWQDLEYTSLGTLLAVNPQRQELILADIMAAVAAGEKVLVLSERVSQAADFAQRLQAALPKVPLALVTGQHKQEQRQQILLAVKHNQYQIMVATGGVVGEGFDWPSVSALFLTFPFSWRGKLIQYVGRVQRLAAGKKRALVYDYLDGQMSIFYSMWRKRLTTYKELGLKIQALS